MNKSLEIINSIRGFISNTNPFRFPHQEETMLGLLTELENELNPQPFVEETPVVEEPIVEEPIVGEILEVTFSEPVLIEETVVEEPIVEEVAVKPTNKRPRKK